MRYRRVVFGTAAVFAATIYLYLSLQFYLASYFGTSVSNETNLHKAIQLEPSNAEYHDLLGRYLAYSGKDPGIVISQYRAAADLNPYVAQYWLDLANAYLVAGRTAEQQESLEKALQAEPTMPRVAWEAANFFLLQGEQDRALRNFQVVLSNDPSMVDLALQLCWRAAGDANVIVDRALPKRADLYFSFLKLLIDKREIAPATAVWDRLVALRQPFSVQLAFPYLRFLLTERQVSAAGQAWQQLATLAPSLSPYLASPSNLVVNGGFEQKVLDGGFDWIYRANSHVDVSIDTSEFHSGARSLSMAFDGQNPGDTGIYQLIPVKPNTAYKFRAAYRTEDLVTASGPRFSISDAYDDTSYVLTDDFIGTSPWRSQQAAFRTGPRTELVLLRVIRDPAGPLIKGRMWIDDLQLSSD